MKKGKWTVDEKKFVEENCDTMHFEDIANKLDRDPRKVRRYIEHILGKSTATSKDLQDTLSVDYQIKKTLVWKELKSQFTPDELKKFMYYWRRIVTQFKEDILATEEMQIVDYIKLDLMMDRLLTQQQQNLLDIKGLETQLVQEKSVPLEVQDFNKIESLNNQIAFRRTAQGAISKEYKELLQEKTKTLEKMKGTREARIKHLESSKESFMGWTKQVIYDGQFREKIGIYMEKMRLAMEQEKLKLGQSHKYIDGTIDLPLLTVETLKEEDKRDAS